MQKLHSFRQASQRPLILALFALISTLSVAKNTVTAQRQSPLGIQYELCHGEDKQLTKFSPLITGSEIAESKAETLARKWFRKEVKSSFKKAIFHFPWHVITVLPKTVNEPTDHKVLAKMDDKSTLENVYKDLLKVRDAVALRIYAHAYHNDNENQEIFQDLLDNLHQVIVEIEQLFLPFEIQYHGPGAPQPKAVTEDATQRKNRDWMIFHDYIILLEFIHDFAANLQNKHCGI